MLKLRNFNRRATGGDHEHLIQSEVNIEMHPRYMTFAEKVARSHIPYPTITVEHMQAAAQRHAAYLKTVSPRDYEMWVFEDGSVLFRNSRGSEERITLDQIQEKSRDFWRSPQRELWEHVFAMWK